MAVDNSPNMKSVVAGILVFAFLAAQSNAEAICGTPSPTNRTA